MLFFFFKLSVKTWLVNTINKKIWQVTNLLYFYSLMVVVSKSCPFKLIITSFISIVVFWYNNYYRLSVSPVTRFSRMQSIHITLYRYVHLQCVCCCNNWSYWCHWSLPDKSFWNWFHFGDDSHMLVNNCHLDVDLLAKGVYYLALRWNYKPETCQSHKTKASSYLRN